MQNNQQPSEMKNELYYSNWQDLDSQLIWIYEGAPARMSGRFENKFLSAWLITAGHLHIGQPHSRLIKAGNWVFAPQKHQLRVFSPDAKIISIKFTLRWPDGRMLFEMPHALEAEAKDHPALEQSARALLHHVESHKIQPNQLLRQQSLSFQAYLQIKQHFHNWLLAYMDSMQSIGPALSISRREDERMLKAQNLLNTHPLDQRLDLQKIAHQIGLSFGHADALFHANHGLTMRSYVDQRRLRAAQHRLKETNQPIKEIAYALGFKDATAYTHWFKKKTGKSPTQYRQWASEQTTNSFVDTTI